MNRSSHSFKSGPTQVFKCHNCGSDVHPFNAELPIVSVTSDCKPFPHSCLLGHCTSCGLTVKNISAEWQQHVSRIYDEYDVYSQGGGMEQVVFNAATGAKVRRSECIVSELKRILKSKTPGTLLDVGCGNGGFLRCFSEYFPKSALSGLEWDNRNREKILDIKQVENFYMEMPSDISFGAISLVHVLEHIPEPRLYLRSLIPLLEDDGVLILQVPDINQNPFDLMIYDHCSHFNMDTLTSTLTSVGYQIIYASDSCVGKELTVFAIPEGKSDFTQELLVSNVTGTTSTSIDWLLNFSRIIETSTANRRYGIFGTSIAASWVAGLFPEKAAFFIDEDINRIGRQHLGMDILSTQDAPKDYPIVMAMIPQAASKITPRLTSAGFEVIQPPLDVLN